MLSCPFFTSEKQAISIVLLGVDESTGILNECFVIFEVGRLSRLSLWILSRVDLSVRHGKAYANDNHGSIPDVIVIGISYEGLH